MEKLRLGLIGCGSMMKNHVKAVTTMDEVDIVALCDVVHERAEAVAEIFPDAFITTDYRELTDKVDAVLVALPHDLHYECGMYFAKKKKHVLIGKNMLCKMKMNILKHI